MSCNSNYGIPYGSICRPDVPYPQVSAESVPSLIANLTSSLYGQISKNVVNGKISWTTCDGTYPNFTGTIAGLPRNAGEGLLCYILRAFNYINGTTFGTQLGSVYISIRTDGQVGTGTILDPYDGSTSDRFDSIMTAIPEYTQVFLGAGTFPTRGTYSNISSVVTSIAVTNGGHGYTSAPNVIITAANGDGGGGATATAIISNGSVTSIQMTCAGYSYNVPPIISFSGGNGLGATANATIKIQGWKLKSGLTIKGAGKELTKIQLQFNGNQPLYGRTSVMGASDNQSAAINDVTICDMTIDANYAGNVTTYKAYNAITCQGNNCVVENCHITGCCGFSNQNIECFAVLLGAPAGSDVYNNRIINCDFDNFTGDYANGACIASNANQIPSRRAYNNEISGCYVNGTQWVAMGCDEGVVTNNTTNNCGFFTRWDTAHFDNVVFSNNVCLNHVSYGVQFVASSGIVDIPSSIPATNIKFTNNIFSFGPRRSDFGQTGQKAFLLQCQGVDPRLVENLVIENNLAFFTDVVPDTYFIAVDNPQYDINCFAKNNLSNVQRNANYVGSKMYFDTSFGTPASKGTNLKIYAANRTDGYGGSGTEDDPYNVNDTTGGAFDRLLRSLPQTGCHLILEAGTYYTACGKTTNYAPIFYPNASYKIQGSGAEVTTIKVANGTLDGTQRGMVVFGSVNTLTEKIELCDFSVDLNRVNQNIGSIGSVTGTNTIYNGSGYTSAPSVTFGTQWVANAASPAAGLQFVVGNGLGGGSLFSVTTQGNFGATAPTQATPNPAGQSAVVSYAGNSATGTANITNVVKQVNFSSGGSGYTSVPAVIFTNASGDTTGGGAAGVATTSNGVVTGVIITSGGSNYTLAPKVSFSGGGGNGAVATSSLTGVFTGVTLTGNGSGYNAMGYQGLAINITGGGGSGAAASATTSDGSLLAFSIDCKHGYVHDLQIDGSWSWNSPNGPSSRGNIIFWGPNTESAIIERVNVNNPLSWAFGSAQHNALGIWTPLNFSGTTSGSVNNCYIQSDGGAKVTAAIGNYVVTSATITNNGVGYTSAPSIQFSGGGATTQATGHTTINAFGQVTSIVIDTAGSGYTSTPLITFSGGGGLYASANAIITGSITAFTILDGGLGYTTAPTISIYGGTTAGATATINGNGVVTGVSVSSSSGFPYGSTPIVYVTGFSSVSNSVAGIGCGGWNNVNVSNNRIINIGDGISTGYNSASNVVISNNVIQFLNTGFSSPAGTMTNLVFSNNIMTAVTGYTGASTILNYISITGAAASNLSIIGNQFIGGLGFNIYSGSTGLFAGNTLPNTQSPSLLTQIGNQLTGASSNIVSYIAPYIAGHGTNDRHKFDCTLNIAHIPTSSTGLVSGDVWSNSNVLTIVP